MVHSGSSSIPNFTPASSTSGATVPVKKRRSLIFRVCRGSLVLVFLLLVFIYFVFVLPFWGSPFRRSRQSRVPLTPPWALECWLWEDDTNSAAAVKQLLDGYAQHDIPVRTILIDSPWSTRYNDFKVDEIRYPEPGKFFAGLQDQGYRVVLWMTCMVDSYSKDSRIPKSPDFYNEAQANGYLAGRGEQTKWWKGSGGFIDY